MAEAFNPLTVNFADKKYTSLLCTDKTIRYSFASATLAELLRRESCIQTSLNGHVENKMHSGIYVIDVKGAKFFWCSDKAPNIKYSPLKSMIYSVFQNGMPSASSLTSLSKEYIGFMPESGTLKDMYDFCKLFV